MIENVIKSKILEEMLLYIKRLQGKTIVIKVGGTIIIDPIIKKCFAKDIIFLTLIGLKIIIVHGGSSLINKLLEKLEIKPKFFNGLRITDEETMDVVEMVLAGKINKGIVNDIQVEGGNAIGICGKDVNLLQTKKKVIEGNDLGFVGEVTKVNINLLRTLLENSIIPVIAPIGKDDEGNTYNINADDAALAIAKALQAEKLIFLTDVLGVLRDKNDDSTLIKEMTINQALSYIKKGVISDGMIPKVKNCIEGIESGIKTIHIINGRKEHSLLFEIFDSHGIGTIFKK